MRAPDPRRLFLLGLCAGVVIGCGRERVELESTPPPPVEVEGSVDRAVATTGDLITYRIRVEHAPDIEVEIPEAGADIAGFRITDIRRDSSEIRTGPGAGRRVEERLYELRADLVGSYVLPPIEVRYRQHDEGEAEVDSGWQTVGTSEIFVEVESVLPAAGEATDIRGLKPLSRPEREIPWLWIGAGLVSLVAVAGLIWWWRRRRRADSTVVIPPHEIAFARLDELRSTDFDDPEAVRRFYFAISEVIRGYVEARFDLNASDLTTEEILAHLAELRDLDADNSDRLSEFLRHSDRVKFAHDEPRPPQIEETYEQALTFVESTKPRVLDDDETESEREMAA